MGRCVEAGGCWEHKMGGDHALWGETTRRQVEDELVCAVSRHLNKLSSRGNRGSRQQGRVRAL